MTHAHLFILVFFGGLLLITIARWRRDMRRFDREDAEIRRLAEKIRRRHQ